MCPFIAMSSLTALRSTKPASQPEIRQKKLERFDFFVQLLFELKQNAFRL